MRLSRTVELLAASGLEVGAFVVSIMAALGVGGLVGASIQADRERQERMRERMIEAADAFYMGAYRAAMTIADASDAVLTGDDELGRKHLDRARAETLEADLLIPRFQLFFPADYPNATGTATETARHVIATTESVITEIEEQLADGTLTQEKLIALGERLGTTHLQFAQYVHALIWARRVRPRGPFKTGFAEASKPPSSGDT